MLLSTVVTTTKNRFFSQSWSVPRWGMIYHKLTWSVLKTIMLFWKCLTWPESEPRMCSHIFEPDRRPSSDPLSSRRMLVPRHHHCRANARERERAGSEQEAQAAVHRGIPTPAGQLGGTLSLPGSHGQGRSDPKNQHFHILQHLVIGMLSAS